MSDVTVIGLGEMGGALARAFVTAGKSVTVWNRTSAKAAVLEQMGATRAPTAAEAVAASPVLVVCLSDYAATSSVLSEGDFSDNLRDRLIVQLTSGTPHQARALESWVTSHGASYLDGSIGAWPRQIGGPDAGILIVGREASFISAEPLLKLLAGSLDYLGENIGHANALSNAGLAYFAAHWIGFSHGAAICEAEGLDPGMFGEMMAEMSPLFREDLRHMGRVIAEGRFEEPEATIRTVSTDVSRLAELSHSLKVGAAFPNIVADIFQRAVDAGFGAEEPSAVIKVLRNA
jgi:3-hydroxyisobutyrate dehydrogenase-like beta-hydroxyacid dehydrogenase